MCNNPDLLKKEISKQTPVNSELDSYKPDYELPISLIQDKLPINTIEEAGKVLKETQSQDVLIKSNAFHRLGNHYQRKGDTLRALSHYFKAGYLGIPYAKIKWMLCYFKLSDKENIEKIAQALQYDKIKFEITNPKLKVQIELFLFATIGKLILTNEGDVLSENERAIAQYILGHCYFFGIGTEKSFDKGIKFIIHSAEMNYPCAIHHLIVLYENFKLNIAPEKYSHYLKIMADNKCKQSSAKYARILLRQGLKANGEQAVPLLEYALLDSKEKKAKQDLPEIILANALNDYAICLYTGRGITQNIDKALYYLEASINAGSHEARNNMGLILMLKALEMQTTESAKKHGSESAIEMAKKACEFFSKAEKCYISSKFNNIFCSLAFGFIELKQALEILVKLPKQNITQDIIPTFSLYCGCNVTLEARIAKFSENSPKRLAFILGLFLQQGFGYSKDPQKSLQLFARSEKELREFLAMELSPEAQKSIMNGIEYCYEKIQKQTLQEKSQRTVLSEMGYALARYRLTQSRYDDQMDETMRILKFAAELGCRDALLDSIILFDKTCKENLKISIEKLKDIQEKTEQQGDFASLINIAWWMFFGLFGIPRDEVGAIKLLENLLVKCQNFSEGSDVSSADFMQSNSEVIIRLKNTLAFFILASGTRIIDPRRAPSLFKQAKTMNSENSEMNLNTGFGLIWERKLLLVIDWDILKRDLNCCYHVNLALARCYSKGWGVPKNDEAACEYLDYCYRVELNPYHNNLIEAYPEFHASFALANCYRTGKGVQKSPNSALEIYALIKFISYKLWISASKQENIKIFTASNPKNLLQMLESAYFEAHLELVSTYLFCFQANETQKSLRIFNQALDILSLLRFHPSPRAKLYLAYCYQEGIGMKADPTFAVDLCEKAANECDLNASASSNDNPLSKGLLWALENLKKNRVPDDTVLENVPAFIHKKLS